MAVAPSWHKTVACMSRVMVLCLFNSHWLSALEKYSVLSAFVLRSTSFPVGLVLGTALSNEYRGAFLILSSLYLGSVKQQSPCNFQSCTQSQQVGKVGAGSLVMSEHTSD